MKTNLFVKIFSLVLFITLIFSCSFIEPEETGTLVVTLPGDGNARAAVTVEGEDFIDGITGLLRYKIIFDLQGQDQGNFRIALAGETVSIPLSAGNWMVQIQALNDVDNVIGESSRYPVLIVSGEPTKLEKVDVEIDMDSCNFYGFDIRSSNTEYIECNPDLTNQTIELILPDGRSNDNDTFRFVINHYGAKTIPASFENTTLGYIRQNGIQVVPAGKNYAPNPINIEIIEVPELHNERQEANIATGYYYIKVTTGKTYRIYSTNSDGLFNIKKNYGKEGTESATIGYDDDLQINYWDYRPSFNGYIYVEIPVTLNGVIVWYNEVTGSGGEGDYATWNQIPWERFDLTGLQQPSNTTLEEAFGFNDEEEGSFNIFAVLSGASAYDNLNSQILGKGFTVFSFEEIIEEFMDAMLEGMMGMFDYYLEEGYITQQEYDEAKQAFKDAMLGQYNFEDMIGGMFGMNGDEFTMYTKGLIFVMLEKDESNTFISASDNTDINELLAELNDLLDSLGG